MKINLFDYLFIIGSSLWFLFFFVRYIIKRFWLVGVRKIDCVIQDVVKEESLFGSVTFSYMTSFLIKGKLIYSKLTGYSSPFVYSVGEEIKVICRENSNLIESLSLKGKFFSIARNFLLLCLTVLSLSLSLKLLFGILTSRWSYFIITIDFVILSFIMLLEGFMLFFETKKNSVKSNGKISGFLERTDNDGDKTFVPIIEYSYKGKKITFQSNTAYSNTKMLNESVKIIHLENLPMIADIDSPYSNWWRISFWCVCLIAGLLIFVIMVNSPLK